MKKEFLLTKEQKIEYWGDGQWVNEPDLITFEHDGIDCKIVRGYMPEPYSKEFCMFGGHLCGYCMIPKDHVWYDKQYIDINVDVHGGLTYSELEYKNGLSIKKLSIIYECGYKTMWKIIRKRTWKCVE